MVVFQSWLDFFSIGVRGFIQNVNYSSSVVFVCWCPFVTILISSTYTRFIVENRDNILCNKNKDSFGTTFLKKNILLRSFINLMLKVSFSPKGTFSINLTGVQLRSNKQVFSNIQVSCYTFLVIHKILVKIFENTGKNISKNIVKLNLEQNINLCCMIIWSTYVQIKQTFDNFMISLQDKTENSYLRSSQLRVIIKSV